MGKHKLVPAAHAHAVPRVFWADSTARTADTTTYSGDEKGIFGVQEDTGAVYYLSSPATPTWTLISASVSSIGSGTDNRVVRYNGTSDLQSSGVTLDDSDNLSGVVDYGGTSATLTGALSAASASVTGVITFDIGANDPTIRGGTADPSGGAGVAATEGSLYLLYGAGAGQLWLKTGAGDTAWTQLSGMIGTGTDNRLARYDGTTAIQQSGITIDDTDAITGAASINLIGTGTDNYLARYNSTAAVQPATSIVVDDTDNITGVTSINLIGTSADNRLARYNSTTAVQGSGITVDDSDNLSGVADYGGASATLTGAMSAASATLTGTLTFDIGANDPSARAGTADPSAGLGVAAQEGSIYLQYGAGAGVLWVKTGVGDTAWTAASTASVGAGTDNRLARYDGTANIQQTGITVDDADAITGAASINLIGTGTDNYLARYDGTTGLQAATSILVGDTDIITGIAKIGLTNMGSALLPTISFANSVGIWSAGTAQIDFSNSSTGLAKLSGAGQGYAKLTTYAASIGAALPTAEQHGLHVTNDTAATAGVPNQYSPGIVLEGQAWETTGGSSDEVQFGLQVQTTSGTAADGSLHFWKNINGAGASSIANLDSSGRMTTAALFLSAESASVPGGAPSAGTGKLWVRNDTPNVLVFTNDAGSDTVLGAGGGGTLDSAYDYGGAGAGRTITVDTGAVTFDADVVDTSAAFAITREPASSAAAVGMTITMGANATGNGITITNNGSGQSLYTTGPIQAERLNFNTTNERFVGGTNLIDTWVANARKARWSTAGLVMYDAIDVASDNAHDIGTSSTHFKKGYFIDLEFGSHSAIGAETVTGFITITDSGGTSRKLAVVS